MCGTIPFKEYDKHMGDIIHPMVFLVYISGNGSFPRLNIRPLIGQFFIRLGLFTLPVSLLSVFLRLVSRYAGNPRVVSCLFSVVSGLFSVVSGLQSLGGNVQFSYNAMCTLAGRRPILAVTQCLARARTGRAHSFRRRSQKSWAKSGWKSP